MQGWIQLASSAGLSMGFSLRMGFEKKCSGKISHQTFSHHPIPQVRCLRRRLGFSKVFLGGAGFMRVIPQLYEFKWYSSYLGRLLTNLSTFLHEFSQLAAFLRFCSTDDSPDTCLRFDLLFFFLFNMRRLCCHSCSYAGCCVFETTEFLLDTSLCPFLNFLLVAFRAIVAAVLFVLGKERSHALPILRVRSNNGESHALREGGSIGGGGILTRALSSKGAPNWKQRRPLKFLDSRFA